jgi:hypothetical protein
MLHQLLIRSANAAIGPPPTRPGTNTREYFKSPDPGTKLATSGGS